MRHEREVYCEVGPGLLLDEQYCAAWRERTCVAWWLPPLVLWGGAVLAGLWILSPFLYRISGEWQRMAHNSKLEKAFIAGLPELPSYLVVLRRAGPEAASVEGGGLM